MKIDDAAKNVIADLAASVKPIETESDEREGDERTIKKVVSKQIKTLKELADACEIDLTEWEIYKWKCAAWQTGMKPPVTGSSGAWKRDSKDPVYSQQFVVMAWMRLRVKLIAAAAEFDALREKALDHVPGMPAIIIHKDSSEDLLTEYSPMDHHIGMLGWGEETGHDDYDIKLSAKLYKEALTCLVSRTSNYVSHRAILVLGNDQQNIDNRMGTTTAGTPQNTDSRYQKVFTVSRDVSIWAVEALLAVSPKIDVIIISGNHDTLAAWHLGDSLRSWFKSESRVNIDNRPLFRKYFQFGTNMLMFTHGNAGKLEDYGKTMAAEQPEMWGATKWREAHTGDKHQRRLVELRGAAVRILPSLRPPDAWTSEHHYIGSLRAAEAYVWHKTLGLIGTATYSVLGRKGKT